MTSNDKKQTDSFLNEFQLEGKGSEGGKIALEDWEDSLDGVNKIVTPETREAFKKIDWDHVPRHRMAIYCHDCRAIVPAELKTFGKKTREVCGNPSCGSKKISKGREDALKVFYHLVDRDGEEIKQPERPKRDFNKVHEQAAKSKSGSRRRGGRNNRRSDKFKKS